jgi:glucose/arabinose dehydrogenase
LLKADRNGDGVSDGRKVLLQDLDLPHGIDIFNGWLYIAETSAVGRIQFNADTGQVIGDYQRIVKDLPDGGNHWTRTLRFGPDGLMYVSIGSSCNVCIEDDQRRAAVLRFNPDGSEPGLFATGLRNSVGFDWSPVDGGLYATENGRDLLGDNYPPDELNRLVKNGFYGWPFAHGSRRPDPDYGLSREQEIESSIAPVHEFRAHNAPLGIKFLRNEGLPEKYKYSALVALHGSWNRTKKDGYKVVSIHQTVDGKFEEIDFMTGFEKNEQVIGRPVAIEESEKGEIYVSDDFASTIYRIIYNKPN